MRHDGPPWGRELWVYERRRASSKEEKPDKTYSDCKDQHCEQDGFGVAPLLFVSRLEDGLAGLWRRQVAFGVLEAAMRSGLDGLHRVGWTRICAAVVGLLAGDLGSLLFSG